MARGQIIGPLRRIAVSGLVALSLLLIGMPGAAADVMLKLSVEGESQVASLNSDGSGVAEGAFTASGRALGTGAVCLTGTVRDEFVTITDDEGPKIIRGVETYTSADGDGSFVARFVGRRTAMDGPVITFATTIVITDGTGACSELDATGVGTVTLDVNDGTVRNSYDLDVRYAAAETVARQSA